MFNLSEGFYYNSKYNFVTAVTVKVYIWHRFSKKPSLYLLYVRFYLTILQNWNKLHGPSLMKSSLPDYWAGSCTVLSKNSFIFCRRKKQRPDDGRAVMVPGPRAESRVHACRPGPELLLLGPRPSPDPPRGLRGAGGRPRQPPLHPRLLAWLRHSRPQRAQVRTRPAYDIVNYKIGHLFNAAWSRPRPSWRGDPSVRTVQVLSSRLEVPTINGFQLR